MSPGVAALSNQAVSFRSTVVLYILQSRCTVNTIHVTNTDVTPQVRRRVARMARMPVKSVELKIITKPGDSRSGFSSYSRGVGAGTGAERRSVEALDRDNSRRLWDLGVR